MDLRLITAPAAEPVTLGDAQEHLRAPTGGADSALIAAWLQAARETVEHDTGRALMPQTWELRLPGFPVSACPWAWASRLRPIALPRPPLISVSSLRYTAPDGTDTLLAPSAYQVAAPSGPTAQAGQLMPAPGTDWPDTRDGDLAAVRIRFQAGYADATEVPAALRAAMLLILGELYENREAAQVKTPAEIPAVRRLLDPYRVHWL